MCREAVVKSRTKSAEEALAALMRQCARAEKSTGDALRLMARWGVEPEKREAVLARLIADRFIDNRRYAAAYVSEKINLSGWGEIKIRHGLRAKGISNDVIDEALSDLDSDKIRERLCAKLQRKAAQVKFKDKYDLKAKLIRYALAQGYNYAMVAGECAKIVDVDDEY